MDRVRVPRVKECRPHWVKLAPPRLDSGRFNIMHAHSGKTGTLEEMGTKSQRRSAYCEMGFSLLGDVPLPLSSTQSGNGKSPAR